MSFFAGKRVTVTGSAGLVGGNLVKRLASEGALVRAVWHNKEPERVNGVEYVQGDLMCRKFCDQIVDGADYFVVASAVTQGAAVLTGKPLAFLTPNIIMNSQMLEAAYYAKVKKVLMFSSTTGYPVQDTAVTEEDFFKGDPFWKYFPVGWMKRFTEVLCRLYSTQISPSMPCLVIRPTNIYGPGDKFDPANSHVLPATIRKVVERQQPFLVWGDGSETRDVIYIDDFIDATVLALEKLNTYEPLNIGLGKGYTIKEMIKICCDIDGWSQPDIQYDPTKPTTIPFRLVDISKAQKLLGWIPRYDVPAGVAKTMDWFRNHYKGI